LEALSSTLLQKLTDARIEHGAAKVFGTPRKLAVKVENVARKQKSIKTEVIGPPTKIGLDEKGNPTVAARKFAQKVNLAVNKLSIKEIDKGSYLCVEKTEKGQPARNILKSILPEVILSTPFPKKMRWADLDIEFARPIYSILALLGKSVIRLPSQATLTKNFSRFPMRCL
jgi:glycyl-tRNA synthetase beta chain